MVRRLSIPSVLAVALVVCFALTRIAMSAPNSRHRKGSEPINQKTATLRLKRVPIIKAAIKQAEMFLGKKGCVFDFQEHRELTQFEPGSAFEYKVRITCETKEGELESGVTIEIEGESLNYGEPLQDIERLSFHMAG